MGVIKFFSSSSYDSVTTNTNQQNLPNPDPKNYHVVRYKHVGSYLVIEIKYLDCINYEGNKIMVYKDCSYAQLMRQKHIDPHFTDNKNYFSPEARFKPDEYGWDRAILYANLINQQ
jgi:hypothetical protein